MDTRTFTSSVPSTVDHISQIDATPLHIACERGQKEVVYVLLHDYEADPNAATAVSSHCTSRSLIFDFSIIHLFSLFYLPDGRYSAA